MPDTEKMIDFEMLYRRFQAPVAALDCGECCAPYNEWGAPFCCDTRHSVPTAYEAEWSYLKAHTDLWHLWQPQDQEVLAALQEQTPQGQVLIACLGHEHCRRDFRAVTCRSFPFFPYITRQGEFIGLSYYWEYEDRCWVISNLQVVTSVYLAQFMDGYRALFAAMPSEKAGFRHYSNVMRRVFGKRKRAIPLLHQNGSAYKISPRSGRLRRAVLESLPKFGPYKIAAEMPFPGES